MTKIIRSLMRNIWSWILYYVNVMCKVYVFRYWLIPIYQFTTKIKIRFFICRKHVSRVRMVYPQVEWTKLWANGKTEMNRYHLNAMRLLLKSKSDINVCQKNASGKDANQHSHITYAMCSMQITLNCQNHKRCLHISSKIDFRWHRIDAIIQPLLINKLDIDLN